MRAGSSSRCLLVFLQCASCLVFFSSSGGWGNIKLKLTTLPRIFIRVVCRFNSVAFATQRYLKQRVIHVGARFLSCFFFCFVFFCLTTSKEGNEDWDLASSTIITCTRFRSISYSVSLANRERHTMKSRSASSCTIERYLKPQ